MLASGSKVSFLPNSTLLFLIFSYSERRAAAASPAAAATKTFKFRQAMALWGRPLDCPKPVSKGSDSTSGAEEHNSLRLSATPVQVSDGSRSERRERVISLALKHLLNIGTGSDC